MKNFLDKYKKLNKPIQIIISLIIIAVVIFLSTLSNVYTETYELERYRPANETIQSPITIENTKETERRQREVLQAIEDRYLISNDVTEERIDYIDELFDVIETVNQPVVAPVDPEETEDVDVEEEVEEKIVSRSRADKLIELKQLVSEEIVSAIEDDYLLTLIATNAEDHRIAYELLTTSLHEIFNEGIRNNEVEDAKLQLVQRFQYSTLDNELKEALLAVGEFAIVENSFFSIEETMEAERVALNNVEPAMIRAGEIIVREGQTITNEIYDKLTLVGLLNSDRNIFPIIGLVILILLLVALLSYSLFSYLDKRYLQLKYLFTLTLITIVTVGVMKSISIFATEANQLYLLTPIAASSLLLKIFFKERIALIYAVIFSVIGTIIFNGQIPGSLNLEAGIYLLAAQISGIAALIAIKDRVAILKSISVTGIVNILVILGFMFLSYDSYQLSEILLFVLYGFISALISGIVTIGALPFFESVLQLLSDTKLLALASPTHPLLRKVLTEAPGTYHHSVMVANLSEAACEAIGCSGLLARVSSYYHDLGKTKQPHYFIENQMGMRNPHDFLSPSQSAEIIINHPYDGAKILKKHKIPQEIIEITEEHHGTSLLKYFYYKEKETNEDVDEAIFRYPGPLPQTKESAIVSICDSVEAAVRSMKEPSQEKIDELINSIVQDRLKDGQFDDSELTFRELTKIKESISETLNGIYHSRIQYPEEAKEAN